MFNVIWFPISVWILLVIGVVGSMVVLVGIVFAVYWCCSKLSATPNTSPLIDPDQQMYTTTGTDKGMFDDMHGMSADILLTILIV